jgi:hypothetical protein
MADAEVVHGAVPLPLATLHDAHEVRDGLDVHPDDRPVVAVAVGVATGGPGVLSCWHRHVGSPRVRLVWAKVDANTRGSPRRSANEFNERSDLSREVYARAMNGSKAGLLYDRMQKVLMRRAAELREDTELVGLFTARSGQTGEVTKLGFSNPGLMHVWWKDEDGVEYLTLVAADSFELTFVSMRKDRQDMPPRNPIGFVGEMGA